MDCSFSSQSSSSVRRSSSRVVVGGVLWCQCVQHDELEHVGAEGIPSPPEVRDSGER